MSATEWMVAIGGVGAIVWVNWYFFLADRFNAPATEQPTPALAASEAQAASATD